MKLFERIAQYAIRQPGSPAILGGGRTLSYAELQTELDAMIPQLQRLGVSTMALDLDNGPAWALLDLAALSCDITAIPLPPFFSATQFRHALTQAGVEMVISDDPQRTERRLQGMELQAGGSLTVSGSKLGALVTKLPRKPPMPEVVKITFTSGTTAEPKGVMLSCDQMMRTVESLSKTVQVTTSDRHVVLTPLAVLLENIAGLYVPLWAGASVVLPPLSETGLLGAAGLDARRMLETLLKYEATTAIFSPQMLQGAITALHSGAVKPDRLRFIAVGGAMVSKRLLVQAAELELAVYEGYGLSEFASVVCLNHPTAQRLGSVGKPLSHIALQIAEDGEVLIGGNCFLGYLGEPYRDTASSWWHSGDIGYLDEEGFLYLRGRRRHIFITAYGRNVSPEWIERDLVLEPAIFQVAVFGEARPWNCAVVVPAPNADSEAVDDAIQRVNGLLPDYARISRWIPADTPFDVQNEQLSGTGRLRRETIFQHYCERIQALYQEELV